MFKQFEAALNSPTMQNSFGYAQQMMECTQKLTTSQAEVITDLCEEVSKEYRETLSSGDPASIQKNWSILMSSAVRANTEAGALLMKNAKEFQLEMAQLMQIPASGLPGQFMKDAMKDMMEVVGTNGSSAPAAKARKAA